MKSLAAHGRKMTMEIFDPNYRDLFMYFVILFNKLMSVSKTVSAFYAQIIHIVDF